MSAETMNLNLGESLPHDSTETVSITPAISLQKRINTVDILSGTLPRKSSFDEVKEERLREL